MLASSRFSIEAASVAGARRFVRSVLCEFPQDIEATAELLTSELATNAIIHGHTAFDVIVSLANDVLRIAVTDEGGGMPVFSPTPAVGDLAGRGLPMVRTLSNHWGVAENRPGKTVWFDLDCAGCC